MVWLDNPVRDLSATPVSHNSSTFENRMNSTKFPKTQKFVHFFIFLRTTFKFFSTSNLVPFQPVSPEDEGGEGVQVGVCGCERDTFSEGPLRFISSQVPEVVERVGGSVGQGYVDTFQALVGDSFSDNHQ